MPGEDLESDDEYLNPVIAGDDGDEEDEHSSSFLKEDIYEGSIQNSTLKQQAGGKKRKRDGRADGRAAAGSRGNKGEAGGGHEEDGSPSLALKGKRSNKPKSPKQMLFDASRMVSERDAEVQAAFLWTCFGHALKMSGDPLDGVDKFAAENFYTPAPSGKGHGGGSEAAKRDPDKSMTKFLRGGAVSSVKRLKKWKVRGSPMVVVVCLSARRAVSILKQLSSLNTRCAKLFPKHMSLEGQASMLRENSFGVAVGTPNRLLRLFKMGSDGGNGGGGSLSLSQTELIVIDCHEDHKKFTVCTLNDTAPDLMRFIRAAAVPEMNKRETLRFAMF